MGFTRARRREVDRRDYALAQTQCHYPEWAYDWTKRSEAGITAGNTLYRRAVSVIIKDMPHESTVLPIVPWNERLHYRDQLRAARYAALADAEGFGEICFAIEAIGLRLRGEKADMGRYEAHIRRLSADSLVLSDLSTQYPCYFTRFDALYETVRLARNDAMHTGVYARHATSAAIELCIGLEEALMKEQDFPRRTVADFMVKAPVALESWQPVAHARQLMLMHSFSFLPVLMKTKWQLVSEVSMAKYLNGPANKKDLLATAIDAASWQGLELIDAQVIESSAVVSEILAKVKVGDSPTLWLVVDGHNQLAGVLSPFKLM